MQKFDAIGNGAGQNDEAAEERNARLVEDMIRGDNLCLCPLIQIAHDASVT